MLSIDLTKAFSHRFLVYLLALFPGSFFLMSIAMGNPILAKGIISRLEGIYPIPAFALSLLLLGSAFFIGMTFVILSRLLELLLSGFFLLGRFAYRKLLGTQAVYVWFGKFQGTPPKATLVSRVVGKLIFLARAGEIDTPDRKSVRWCLAAATEKLLEKRYGIDAHRATGPNGGEWQVWYSVMGQPVKNIVESLNGARTAFASGVAGFVALGIAPVLIERYYISMCSVLAVSSLWTTGYFYFQTKHPIGLDCLRLRAVLTELQELPSGTPESKPKDRLAAGKV